MTVEPTYRPDYEKHYALMRQWSGVVGPEGARTLLDASLIPDTHLQAIKDAPRCEHGNVYEHMRPTGEWKGVGPSQDDWCEGAPKLAALLDALTEENNESTTAEKRLHAESRLRLAVTEALGFYDARAITQIVNGTFNEMDALTEEQPVSKFVHGKRDHDELIESGLLDPDQPTEYATHQTRSDTKEGNEPMCTYCGWSGQGIAKHQLVCKHLSDALIEEER